MKTTVNGDALKKRSSEIITVNDDSSVKRIKLTTEDSENDIHNVSITKSSPYAAAVADWTKSSDEDSEISNSDSDNEPPHEMFFIDAFRTEPKVLTGEGIGDLTFNFNGSPGHSFHPSLSIQIPVLLDDHEVKQGVTDVQTNAEYLLLALGDFAYEALLMGRWYDKYPTPPYIVIGCWGQTAGRGPPDRHTLHLFSKIVETYKDLPVRAITECTPDGLKFLSEFLPCKLDIDWLGPRIKDWDKFQVPEWCREPMTNEDEQTMDELLRDPNVQQKPKWVEEFKKLLSSRKKVDAGLFGPDFTRFVADKLENKDWI